MRFAVLATAAAAAVAVPFAVAATGPQMTADEFLSAVRCVAYEDAVGGAPNDVKYRLNTEARLQPAATAAIAREEVSAIARAAVNTESGPDAAMIRQERTAACQGVQVVDAYPAGAV